MAASTMAGAPYLQLGPRQGVYCRPSVVLTSLPGGGYDQQYIGAGGGRLKWRLSQFKSPEHNYRRRARSDSDDLPVENIPEIPGKIIERPSSAVSQQKPPAPRSPVKMTKSRSSCNLQRTTSGSLVTRPPSAGTQIIGAGRFNGPPQQDKHRKSSTVPVFSVQASAVTIQSRAFARSLVMPPRRILPPEEPFPYPDPVRMSGDHAFNVRLAEMTRLQKDTIKIEESRARIARRNFPTVSSSQASSSTNTNPNSNTVSNNSNKLGRPSSGVPRSPAVNNKSGIHRTTSLPTGPTTTLNKDTQSSLGPSPAAVTPKGNPDTLESKKGPRKGSSSHKTHTTPPEVEHLNSHYFNEIAIPKDEPKVDEPSIDTNPITPELTVVEPKTHHRELVEAIFSGSSNPNTSGDKVVEHKAEDIQTTQQTMVRKSSATRSRSSKSKSTSSSKATKAPSPSSPCSPTIDTRPPSSASSGSTCSDHPASGKKSSTKSLKTRKPHKKSSTSRHKHH